MLSPEEADRLFASLKPDYADRRSAAEAEVQTWQWGTRPWLDLRPLHFERHNYRRGRLLKRPPSRTQNRVEVGFDAVGRVHVQREHTEFGPYESFYRWADTLVEVATYHFHDQTPINVLVVAGPVSHPDYSELVAEQGWVHEEYTWAGGRLSEARVSHTPRVAGHYLTLERLHTAVATYEGDELALIELHWPPQPPGRPAPVIEIAFRR